MRGRSCLGGPLRGARRGARSPGWGRAAPRAAALSRARESRTRVRHEGPSRAHGADGCRLARSVSGSRHRRWRPAAAMLAGRTIIRFVDVVAVGRSRSRALSATRRARAGTARSGTGHAARALGGDSDERRAERRLRRAAGRSVVGLAAQKRERSRRERSRGLTDRRPGVRVRAVTDVDGVPRRGWKRARWRVRGRGDDRLDARSQDAVRRRCHGSGGIGVARIRDE